MPRSFGWVRIPTTGPVHVNSEMLLKGPRAGWPRFFVKKAAGGWTAIQLDDNGALLALVHARSRGDAYTALEAALTATDRWVVEDSEGA